MTPNTEKVSLESNPFHADAFLDAVGLIAIRLDRAKINTMANDIARLRAREHRENGGRLFILGMGGSAANASHAANDFRKIAKVEAYAASDNIAEMTARINDDGVNEWMVGWLEASAFGMHDAILVLSVGGGRNGVSQCIVEAVRYALQRGALVLGIVGSDDGYTARYGHNVIVVPTVKDEWRTPLTESFQAVIWHCIVNHPALKS